MPEKGDTSMMNYIWLILIAVSCFCAAAKGNVGTLTDVIVAGGAPAITLCLKLMGVICFWSGMMRIAEEAGLTRLIARAISPLMRFLFPKLKKDSPAVSAMSMNITATLLGLGSAATPFGLEAMSRLKAETGVTEGTASNEMVRFIVMNTAAVHLLPTTVAMLRSEYGSKSPMDILVPALLTSLCAITFGVTLTFVFEKGGRLFGKADRLHTPRRCTAHRRIRSGKGRQNI